MTKSKNNTLVCVVGMAGFGKSVISNYLVETDYEFFHFDQIVLDIIKEKKLPLNEKSEKSV